MIILLFFRQGKIEYGSGTIVFIFGPTIVSFIVEYATRLLKLVGVANHKEDKKVHNLQNSLT